jgi:DNA mismatch repair protein MutS
VKARSRTLPDFPPLSLLFPQGKRAAVAAEPAWARDLRLDDLISAFAAEPRYANFIRQTLTALTADPEVIAWRQAVLNDFLENAALVQTVEQLLPRLAELRQGRTLLGQRQRPPLLETADRLAELDLFISTAQQLHNALQKATLRAVALRTLRDQLARLIADPNFVALRDELPMLQRPLQKLASLTIGVNLDAQLQPSAAVLLSINEQPFGEPRSFLSKLIGQRADPNDESPIAPLHTLPEERHYRLLSPLFQDLERIVSSVVQPVARSLSKYVRISAAPLTNLEQELAFYLSAVRLVQLLRERGIPLTQPQVMASEARLTRIEGLISLHLVLRQPQVAPVPNDVQLDDHGRIAILTGPNSGGKTTYLQAVGLAHVLFQAGLPIAARSAQLSPVDAIFTHFPMPETQQQGRLAEEAARLRHICLRATAHSLVLMNESLSSTVASEATYLAQDVLCGLRAIGVRAVYATHLLDLPDQIPEIHAAVDGDSALFSLVAGVRLNADGEAQPTFQILRGMPHGRGYAREIARRHGISLEQILAARADLHASAPKSAAD